MRSFNEVYEEIYKSNHDELEKIRKDRAKKTVILTAVTIIGIFLIIRSFKIIKFILTFSCFFICICL